MHSNKIALDIVTVLLEGIESCDTVLLRNSSKWKNSIVEEVNCNLLESIHSCVVVCVAKPYCTGAVLLFHWKVLWLPINP